MQDSEHKSKHAGRHAAAREKVVSEKREADDVLKPAELPEDDYDLYGDEADIPVRLKRKPAPGKAKKKSASGKKKKKRARRPNAIPSLFSDKKFRRKKSIFEIMSGSESEHLFKPLKIFGHEIRFWPIFLLIFLVMLVGVLVISNSNIKLQNESLTVVGLPKELENYNILVISDLNGKHFGDAQSSLIRQVDAVKYDMILCVGDMVGSDGDPAPFYEFLEGIANPSKVYFVCGDSDPGPYVETARDITGTLQQIVLEDWILGAIDRGAHYVDAPVCVTVDSANIWLTPASFLNLDASSYLQDWKDQTAQEEDGTVSGLTSDYNTLPFTSYRYLLAQQFYSAVNSMTSSDLLIALSHQVPDDDFIRSVSAHDADEGKFMMEPELIVSGHYCGGVWKLPLVGAFYVPNRMLPRYGWFPDQEDVSGLSQIGECQVYITGGLSTTSAIPVLPFRLLNSPEITQLTLTATLPENMLDAAG